jgi:hypothetical protein
MATTKTELVEIKPIEMKTMEIEIIGDTPLIMHAWSEKAKRMMLETQQGKAKGKKKPVRNPVDDFIQSLYWLTEKPVYKEDASEEECEKAFNEAISKGAKFGFPITAFKQAGNAAAYRMGWVKNQTGLKGAYFLNAEFGDMVEIISDTPIMREDMVKIGMGTADIRYRGEFRNWRAKFKVTVNTSGTFNIENILNVINAGGVVCGVGEWRPEKDGQFGMYHIKTE